MADGIEIPALAQIKCPGIAKNACDEVAQTTVLRISFFFFFLNTSILPGTSWSCEPGSAMVGEREGMGGDGRITGATQVRFFPLLVGGERWTETMGKRGGGGGLHVSSYQQGLQVASRPSRVKPRTTRAGCCAPTQKGKLKPSREPRRSLETAHMQNLLNVIFPSFGSAHLRHHAN